MMPPAVTDALLSLMWIALGAGAFIAVVGALLFVLAVRTRKD